MMKEKLYEAYEKARDELTDADVTTVGVENFVDYIILPDGKKAQISIKIDTDEAEFWG